MGEEELKWRQIAHYHLICQQGPHFEKLKPMITGQISGRMLSSGIRGHVQTIFGKIDVIVTL